MTDHLDFETLCDLADGVLDAEQAERAQAHARTCAECGARLASLTMLTTQAANLPHEIAPPDGLWADIRREIAPVAGRPTRAMPMTVGWLAAAGIVIAVASSGITAVVLRNRAPAQVAISTTATSTITALPARLAVTEGRYTRDIELLQRTLAERRDSLAPSTVETIERSLRIADSAIAEARAALTQDPANAALVALFASNYERKIDLLKRATELAPRT